MTKNEFLEQLRLALSGKVPQEEIISQIKYYDSYIMQESTSRDEHIVIEEIGSPNLIAKTIIDSYKRAYGPTYKGSSGEYEEWDSHGYATWDKSTKESKDGSSSYDRRGFYNEPIRIPWYVKLLLIFIVLIAFILLIILGSIFLRLLLVLAPIFIIVFIILKLID